MLGNGRVLLLAYDSFDREFMKIILHQKEELDGIAATKTIEEFHISNLSSSHRKYKGYVYVDQHSSSDDVTSDGMASQILIQQHTHN